jgi:hypothetical protein
LLRREREEQWIKDLKEVASYCAEYDDYKAEKAEVVADEGTGIPYTYGFYLIGQLVGAMNPVYLDVMDEVLFTIPQIHTRQLAWYGIRCLEYKRYFDGFLLAQRNKVAKTDTDRFKQSMSWARHYNAILSERMPWDLPAVIKFKIDLVALENSGTSSGGMTSIISEMSKMFGGFKQSLRRR